MMSAREERRLLCSVLMMAVVMLGLVILFSSGCSTGLRKSISVATTAIEVAGDGTDKLCMQYAKTWCKTNPCPDLETCKKAYQAWLEAGVAAVEAGRMLNKVIR